LKVRKPREKKGKTRFGFTMIEEQTVRLLIKYAKVSKSPIRAVARELRITPHAVRMALFRLRNRYDRALDFIETYRDFKRRLPRRKYL